MEAVKKAYAEIILNMAKEAAARVMASEQKTLKLQQELHSTKEESLRMLLRMKLMIDDKTTDAESMSQNQQRKIDELEAQLNEAEGLIIDLRAELDNVQEQLKVEKNKHPHYLRPHDKEDLVCPNSIIAKDNHVFTSEIVKSNGPEIIPNGCKQSRAVEMSLADARFHSAADPSFPLEVKQVTQHLKGHGSKQRPYTFRGKRRRKARYGKTRKGSCMVRCNNHVLSQWPLQVISRYKDGLSNRSTNTEEKEAGGSFVLGKRETQNKDLSIVVARRSLRKRRVKYVDDLFPPSFPNSKSSSVECTNSIKLGGEADIKEVFGKPACAANDLHEDNELIDVPVTAEEGDDKSQLSLGILPVESVLEVAETFEGSKESPVRGNNNTLLKYTFNRKRKKDTLLNPSENSFPESSMKKRSAGIENIDLRLQDPKLENVSSLKSKQLVQVAHQLISLSGRSC